MGRLTRSLSEWLGQCSLLQRLLLVEGAIFLVVLGGAVVVVDGYADGLRDRILHERLITTRAFGLLVEETLAGGVEELRLVAAATDLHSDGQAGTRSIDLLARGSRLFTRGALVTDAAFRVVATDSEHDWLRGQDLAAYAAGGSAGVGGALAWGYRPEAEGVAVVAIAVPLGDVLPGGYMVGLADVVDSTLGNVLARSRELADTGHADLVEEGGISLASTDVNHVLVTSDHPEFYRAMLASDHGSAIEQVAYEGGEEEGDSGDHVMGFVQLETFPWGFALGGSAAETFAPIRRLWFSVFGLTAVMGAFALVATVVGTSSLVRPVNDLRDAAQRVAGGDLETPLEVSTGGEIGELAESIETMRQSLYAWGTELDRRVSERTQELERRSRELAASAAVARAVSSTLDLEAMIDIVAAEIEQQLGVDGVVIYLRGEAGRPPLLRASSRVPDHIARAPAAPCDYCIRMTGETRAIARVAADEDADDLPRCLGSEFASVVIVPLLAGDELVGSMCVLQGEERLQETDVDVLRLLVDQAGTGIHNAMLYADLQRREAHRQTLLAKVLRAQEEERSRLARELHDETAQELTALMFGLDGLARGPLDKREWILDRIAGLRTLSEEALENLRMMILAIRPPALDDLGLVPALERYADRVVRSGGITVEIDSSLSGERLPPDWEVTVFRITQEALNNVVRHSGASEVYVRISEDGGKLTVEVRDNGRGFTAPEPSTSLAGVGIEGMIERAELLGGELSVESAPDHGTTVRLEVHR